MRGERCRGNWSGRDGRCQGLCERWRNELRIGEGDGLDRRRSGGSDGRRPTPGGGCLHGGTRDELDGGRRMDGNQNRCGAIAGDRGDENPDEKRVQRARAARGGWGFAHPVDYTLPGVNLSFLRVQAHSGHSSTAAGPRHSKAKPRVENVGLDCNPIPESRSLCS